MKTMPKPCPFCGAVPDTSKDSHGTWWLHLTCEPKCIFRIAGAMTYYSRTRRRLIAMWNMREWTLN